MQKSENNCLLENKIQPCAGYHKYIHLKIRILKYPFKWIVQADINTNKSYMAILMSLTFTSLHKILLIMDGVPGKGKIIQQEERTVYTCMLFT